MVKCGEKPIEVSQRRDPHNGEQGYRKDTAADHHPYNWWRKTLPLPYEASKSEYDRAAGMARAFGVQIEEISFETAHKM